MTDPYSGQPRYVSTMSLTNEKLDAITKLLTEIRDILDGAFGKAISD